jgi:predicted CoA-binding protein
MPSDHETFWQMQRFAVVGHQAARPFPKLTYGELKKTGKAVYPIDTSQPTLGGDRVYSSFSELPEPVEAAVIEVPQQETLDWCKKAVEQGIKDIWLHMNTESDAVLTYAQQHGVRLRTGTCAVMYLHRGFSPHAIHRWFRKRAGKY